MKRQFIINSYLFRLGTILVPSFSFLSERVKPPTPPVIPSFRRVPSSGTEFGKSKTLFGSDSVFVSLYLFGNSVQFSSQTHESGNPSRGCHD
jgi:hypothetical protein